jgi:DNA-binding beta-propeller fold protein YncE
MAKILSLLVSTIFAIVISTYPSQSEILAMVSYESKPAEDLAALNLPVPDVRTEGIAIIDVDPESPNFGDILMDIPLPNDLVAHHIFYDKDMEKAYVTALGKSEIYVIRMDQFPYRLRKIDVPGCEMGEDVAFSEDNTTWYLTCMNSGNVFVGDSATDTIRATIPLTGTYPHGLVVLSDIDRLLVTSTISGDLSTPDEVISSVEASTLRVLGQIKVSGEESPSGVAPVELLRVPGSDPAQIYVTNMFDASLWMATWNPGSSSFDVSEVFDFASTETGVPLEIYFNPAGDRMYVTTSSPGNLHTFDISEGAENPKLLSTVATAEGAHHVAFTRDWRYGFVQNSFINLPNMRDGSITVIDMQNQEMVASVDTLKNMGFNPNSIVLLPEWNHLAGH